MKKLQDYIEESLLGGFEEIEKEADEVFIKEFLQKHVLIRGKYTIKDRVVDVVGDVYYRDYTKDNLTNGQFKYGEVTGTFDCCYCAGLKSLEGAPKEVGGNFSCYGCYSLESLEGAPEKVGETFDCNRCTGLTSLKGAPKTTKYFNCSYCDNLKSLKGAPISGVDYFGCDRCNKLKTLEGAPEIVTGYFDCNHCTGLTSLKGAPKEVGKGFCCTNTGIKDLTGCPKKSPSFNFSNCSNLESLKGAPKEIEKDFAVPYCALTTLKDCPEKVGRVFDISFNYKLKSLDEGPKEVYDYIMKGLDLRNNKTWIKHKIFKK